MHVCHLFPTRKSNLMQQLETSLSFLYGRNSVPKCGAVGEATTQCPALSNDLTSKLAGTNLLPLAQGEGSKTCSRGVLALSGSFSRCFRTKCHAFLNVNLNCGSLTQGRRQYSRRQWLDTQAITMYLRSLCKAASRRINRSHEDAQIYSHYPIIITIIILISTARFSFSTRNHGFILFPLGRWYACHTSSLRPPKPKLRQA